MQTMHRNVYIGLFMAAFLFQPLHGFREDVKVWGKDAFFAIGALGGCLYLLDRATGFYFRTFGCDFKNNGFNGNRRSRISKHQQLIEDLDKKIKQLHDDLASWEKRVDGIMPIIDQFTLQVSKLKEQFNTFATHASKSPKDPVTRNALIAYEEQLTSVMANLDVIKRSINNSLDNEKTKRALVAKEVSELKRRQDELTKKVETLRLTVAAIDAEVFEPVQPANKEGGVSKTSSKKN